MTANKHLYTVHVAETDHCWGQIEVEAESEEQVKQLAEDQFRAESADHATSEIETTIFAVDANNALP